MDMNFSWLFSPAAKLALAGALGGVVRWLTLKQPPLDGLISVIVGAICAVYLGPSIMPILRPVIDLTGVDAESAIGLGGFLIGIGGILVSGFFIDLWQLRRRLLKQPPQGGQGDGQA
jgi:hypothetical protein